MIFYVEEHSADQAHLNSKISMASPRTLMASTGPKPARCSVEKSADFPALSVMWLTHQNLGAGFTWRRKSMPRFRELVQDIAR